jgi:serine/threonine-protein kinase CHEK2
MASAKDTLKRERVGTSPDPSAIPTQSGSQGSTNDDDPDLKRLRTTKDGQASQLPTPVTYNDSSGNRSYRDGTATPPEGRPSQIQPSQHQNGFSQLDSPPVETQAFSQLTRPPAAVADGVEDEEKEGVWGYLIPLDSQFGETLVLRRRAACPAPCSDSDFGQASERKAKGGDARDRGEFLREENEFEERKAQKGLPSSGYLIGRHRECGEIVSTRIVWSWLLMTLETAF